MSGKFEWYLLKALVGAVLEIIIPALLLEGPFDSFHIAVVLCGFRGGGSPTLTDWWWVAINNGRPLFFVSLMRYWDLLHVLNVVAFLINHRILMRRH